MKRRGEKSSLGFWKVEESRYSRDIFEKKES